MPGPLNALARPRRAGGVGAGRARGGRVSYGGGLYDAARAHTARLLDVVRAGGDPFGGDHTAASG
ncbi:hypothetical protein [Micromonospora sp. NPDC047730]|uniref:hypothetical protein n=1 Tax=Micromonospora sp. NPDC047730 TaxID=3364253 RepID=UPI00372103EE